MRSDIVELSNARAAVREATLADEAMLTDHLVAATHLSAAERAAVAARAADVVRTVRGQKAPGLMETFLAEYGLSTEEGVALMCLAEALLRVPDSATVDMLIEDKIAPADWGRHLGRSPSTLVNASTFALLLTGRLLDDGSGVAGALKGVVRRLGEPVIRAAVAEAMRRLGRQFVLGETIGEALRRAEPMQQQGWDYSFDMLGEAAKTLPDAARYLAAYERAIDAIAARASSAAPRANPGISIKLSALHPRYEQAQREACVPALAQIVVRLARRAAAANLGLNIDAEEQERLDLSLDIFAAVAEDSSTRGWDGLGLVVQAYGRRALPVVRWVDALARETQRKLTVRLVKGAYWDYEIKRSQVFGTATFPVFTRKGATDISYLACARALLDRAERIYPQFATHNANTIAAVLQMAAGMPRTAFEFQKLHGMGGGLYEAVRAEEPMKVRIYAPVGAHEELLAYLVRRLLENGANSSFAHQIVDPRVPAEVVAQDPVAALAAGGPSGVREPPRLFDGRRNSAGWDLAEPPVRARFEEERGRFRLTTWTAAPMVVGEPAGGTQHEVRSPSNPRDLVGYVRELDPAAAPRVIASAAAGVGWAEPAERAAVLRRAADLYEAHAGEFFALAAREAGKTAPDCVSELREAVDFLRFYAAEAGRLLPEPAGVVVAISPWNFPLAIFTGQIAAALAAGNAVVAKPAPQTPLIAGRAAHLLHEAGVPRAALQLAPGGGEVGAALVSVPGIAAVAFTGSTATAKRIDRQLATSAPEAVLVAETGGINAMIVDSTALPEQAVRDIVTSAFQSAGQRCSALRVLYVQEDVAEKVERMLEGAMETLVLGDPWPLSTDIGPVIDDAARDGIEGYVAAAGGRRTHASHERFVAPTVIRVGGIEAVEREVFGPVLHLATFRGPELMRVVERINAKGFGLTFALHTRIDGRVEEVTRAVTIGNAYVNRNQIGAVVGSQPFGGEGLSGTGPKAGGPHTVARLARRVRERLPPDTGRAATAAELQRALDAARASPMRQETLLPGPTGEENRLAEVPRGKVICAGPTLALAERQAAAARAAGCGAVVVAPGSREVDAALDPAALTSLAGLAAVAFEADDPGPVRRALAAREGPIVPVLAAGDRFTLERHVCIDTTAAGGNAQLLAGEDAAA